jgi:hypothetical protein
MTFQGDVMVSDPERNVILPGSSCLVCKDRVGRTLLSAPFEFAFDLRLLCICFDKKNSILAGWPIDQVAA